MIAGGTPARTTNGYDYDRATLLELFVRLQFPERTPNESALIRDFLQAHILEYDPFSFSVRVGQGLTPDPQHLPGVQRSTAFSSRKRIDILAWRGDQPFIFEVKQRVNPAALGQLHTYAHLWQEEHPDARVPILGAIGRSSDADTLRVLAAQGVTVYLYATDDTPGSVPGSGVSPVHGAPA